MSAALSNAAFHALNKAMEPSLQERLEEAEYQLYVAERRSDPYMHRRETARWSAEIKRIKALMKGATS
ncbi:hypothetical protein QFZ34_002099 [Phyllobacterium ifriqiyense]|uniref:Uncharacterized protein n=1 Tax=Phyllobacterium ifriqiyense TaxID=314238 RepID=A0ABU0S846_9HYPH|nr:hypothetical protein [Phyllobacterium ifriqiyense]MDQ0996917.1 hypothetical protein [Phyllobacterium ifriqiyense]